ncbi:hypothetical protein CFC21_014021 [Triticum aestivum]|uniref:Uncharacterized protein n=2 Tax=Triticum aestivum TaxID=4565 RepID=A0A3B6A1R7_WHEAT|nr:hypothetical protein CFC21_014021 [Triticum aestivum]
MPMEIMELDTQGNAGNGISPSWMEKVKLKILREAEGVSLSIPPYFSRFDAIGNTDYPSIFKPRPKPTQQPQNHTGTSASREPAQSMGRSIMVAAVGPYHGPSDLACVQPQPPLIAHAKKCAIVKFLAGEDFNLDTAGFLGWARQQEARVRSCYERDSFTMGSEELAEMLLLDGCLLLFAVFLLRSSVREDQRPAQLTRDAKHRKVFVYLSADMCLHMKQTRLDLLMLGNQIPFFVLTELHRLLRNTFFHGIQYSIEELALSCFDDIHPTRSGFIKQDEAAGTTVVHHLLHLFHCSRVPKGNHGLDDTSFLRREPDSHLPCATWLEESHTSFSKQAAPGSSSSLHIVFQRKMFRVGGVMHVPAQHIHGYSESVFRNLIAFEQSHQRCGLGVTAYSMCMARLLQTEDDAKLLRKSGILAHTHKTDKEIVDLFSELSDEYRNTFYSRDLLDLCKDVAAYHHSTAAKAVKWVGQQCFPRQSVTFFVIFGALISVATLVNTGYSVYRFYHPVK